MSNIDYIDTPEVLTKAEFSFMIEEYAKLEQTTLINSMLDVCEKYDIDVINMGKMITPDLKEKLAISENIHAVLYGKCAIIPE